MVGYAPQAHFLSSFLGHNKMGIYYSINPPKMCGHEIKLCEQIVGLYCIEMHLQASDHCTFAHDKSFCFFKTLSASCIAFLLLPLSKQSVRTKNEEFKEQDFIVNNSIKNLLCTVDD